MGAELEAPAGSVGAGERTAGDRCRKPPCDNAERCGKFLCAPAGGVAREKKGTCGRAGNELGELIEENGKITVDREGLALRSVAPGGGVEDDAVVAVAAAQFPGHERPGVLADETDRGAAKP
jgi:hypothetical protein